MKNKNNIDELKELFETMQKDVAMCNHLSDNYLADLNNIIKEVVQRKVEEIISKIKKFEIPENAEVVNGDDVDIKSFQNILIDLILKELIKNK